MVRLMQTESPCGAAMIVRSLQTEEPMWGCNNNNSEIVATSILVLNNPKRVWQVFELSTYGLCANNKMVFEE